MSLKRSQLLMNLGANAFGSIVHLVSGLITTPHLVHSLGTSVYGTWSLVVAVTSILLIVDLGVAGAIGRQIARATAQEDQEARLRATNAIMSTGLAMLFAVSCVVMVIALALPAAFSFAFHTTAEAMPDVRAALLLSALNIAVTLPTRIFSGLLWGHARFDLINAIDIPIVLLRTIGIILLINRNSSLTDLALLIIAFNTLGAALLLLVAWRFEPRLVLRPAFVSVKIVRDLYGFGIWYCLLGMSRTILGQIGPAIIGNRIDNRTVAQFAAAKQLSSTLSSFSNELTQVAAPSAMAVAAGSQQERTRQLFLFGGRCSAVLALFLAIGATLMATDFIRLWQRGALDDAAPMLQILALGELLPMSQWMTYSSVLAAGKHRRLAIYALIEGALIVLLSIVLIGHYGGLGVCAAVAVSGTAMRGVAQCLYGCRLEQVSLTNYVREAVLPPLAASVVPFLFLWMLVANGAAATWFGFLAVGAAYAMVFAGFAIPCLFGYRQVWSKVRRQALAFAGRP